MEVPLDFVCEHGMPQPWATCTDCMLLPRDEQPVPEKPPAPPEPERPARKRRTTSRSGGSGSRAPRTPRAPAARLPRGVDDDMPELTGRFDLAYEVPDDNVSFHLRPPDHDWLPISALPKDLRAHGWVYLQVDRAVVARCRVRGIGYRDSRWTQEPSATTHDAGPGPTIELDGDAWERLREDLGVGGDEPTPGYRYLQTGPDDRITVAPID